MKVLEYNNKIYYLKLSVKQYIAIHQLGLIERLAEYPTTLDYLSICNILMSEYEFNEDEIYDFMDYIVEEYDIHKLIEELLIDSGIMGENKGNTEVLEESESNLSDDDLERHTDVSMTFEEELHPLMRDCLACGMDIDTFYSMTLKELEIYIEGIKEKIKRENHDRATLDYALANLITIGTGVVLGGKSQFPSYDDYYGGMFGDNQVNEEDLVLEGYADGTVPVYRRKIDNVEDDIVRQQLLALAMVSKAQSIQKNNIGDGVE